MTQRKLTDDEMDNVMVARCALRKIRQSIDSPDCLRDTVIHLGKLALHATTDGNPYVDPEPTIPDGYRLAVAGDEGREDCVYWQQFSGAWKPRSFVGREFSPDSRFAVPTDVTPTDEEASQLPIVMVRDYPDRLWEKSRLVRVSESGYSCLAASRRNLNKWAYCRHLYPGE